MKSAIMAFLAAGLVVSASPAHAASILIDFEGPTSFASIDQYYNGGTDSAGASGPNLHVSFGLDALAIQNDALGPYFSNAPSPIGVMAPVGGSAALNFANGFVFASFFYSSAAATTVGVYSGLDGTGTLLDSVSLASNAQLGCSNSPFCNWTLATLSFNGIARSIGFGNAAGVAGFDNVTLLVPEPGSLALLTLGLAGLGAVSRSRRSERGHATS